VPTSTKKAARALLRAAFVNDCRFPGSAAAYTIDEQRKGFGLGQRKKSPAGGYTGARRGGPSQLLALCCSVNVAYV
jgi:hypothetical protein